MMNIIVGLIEKAHEVLTALIGFGITLLTLLTVMKVIIHSIKNK